MDCVTIYGTDRGAAPVVCPPFTVATYTLQHPDTRDVTVLFVIKTKEDDSTYEALDKAAKKLRLPRETFEKVPYYDAAFVENGGPESYAIVHLKADKSGVLTFDAANSSRIAGGTSVLTGKALTKKYFEREDADEANAGA